MGASKERKVIEHTKRTLHVIVMFDSVCAWDVWINVQFVFMHNWYTGVYTCPSIPMHEEARSNSGVFPNHTPTHVFETVSR